MSKDSAPPLFDRLPCEIFRPLGAGNNRRYWEVLHHLITQIWGEGGRSPGEDVQKSAIIRVIESHLLSDDPWECEEGITLETPLSIRANGIYGVFRDSGWLTQRRRGVLDMVTIRPVVAQFFTVLCDFALHEPEFLGSKVRSICLNLREIAAGKARGDAYAEAAHQAKRCMAHIANTGCRVHDLMDQLVAKASTREFVKGFFEEYVEKVFIADYSEIRTKDHPLQHRAEIVSLTYQFQHDPTQREALIAWYRENPARGDAIKAEWLYERDTQLILRLRDVEQHLQRLDDEIRIANQRAIAFIEYKMRAPKNFDKLVAKAISASEILPEGHLAFPTCPVKPHASEYGLAKARQYSREQVATRLDRREPTVQELALQSLRKRMADNRMVNPERLAQYVSRHLNGVSSVTSDNLEITSISDLSCYQRLHLIATRSGAPKSVQHNDPHLRMLRKVKIEMVPGAMTHNDYMEHRQFIIRKESA